MSGRKFHFMIMAFLVIAIGLPFTVWATTCTASNLMLGVLSGSLNWNGFNYVWSGSCKYTFNCSNGDTSACTICSKTQYFQDNGSGGWTLLDTDNNSTSGLCGYTGIPATATITFPSTGQLSYGTIYQIGFTVSYPLVGGDCSSTSGSITSTTSFLTPAGPPS